LNELVAKGAFPTKVCPPIYTTVHVVMHVHQRNSIVQEEGLTNEGRYHLQLQHEYSSPCIHTNKVLKVAL